METHGRGVPAGRPTATARWRVPLAACLVALAFGAAVPAAAQVAQLDGWAQVYSNDPPGGFFNINVGNITPSAGPLRLLVVAAVLESSAVGTVTGFTATVGGTPLTALASTEATSARDTVKIWYLLNANIPAGPAALVVTGTHSATATGLDVYWASFTRVDQASPIVGSSANYASALTVTFGGGVNYVANGWTLYAAGNGSAGATHTPPTGPPPFIQRLLTQTSGQTSVIADTGVHAAGGNYPANTTVTFTNTARSVVAVGSLRPAPLNDLSITKTDSADPILVGQTTTYTITVTNGGPSTATNVVVTDNLPAGMTFGTPTPSQGTCAGTSPMICNLGTINSGASATITIVGTATAIGTVSNTATVAAAQGDPNPANNSATQTTTVAATVNLAITKVASSTSVWLGDTLTFSLAVSNSGPSNATNVTVVDTLPAGLTLVSAVPSQGTCSGTTTITCNLGNVNAGAGATITITVTADAVGTQVNGATVSASEGDPSPANNSANAFTVVTDQTRNADVRVAKTGLPASVTIGGNVTYTVTVTNDGPESADDVRLDDPMPAGMTFVSATPTQGSCTGTTIVLCSLGRLANGASATVTIVATNNSSGTKANVVTVTNLNPTEYDPNPVNNVATAVTTVTGGLAPICGGPGKDGAPPAPLSVVVNTYYPGTANVAAGVANTCIPLGTARGAAATITANDLLLVIQMQDATIDTSNDANYGDGAGGADGAGALAVNAGKYEFVRTRGAVGLPLCAAGSVPVFGSGTNNGLLNAYTNADALTSKGQERYQIVRVPQYTAVTLAGVAAAPWVTSTVLATPGGTGLGTGGILAIDVQGTLTLNSGVAASANGLGFRGAAGRQLAGSPGAGADYLSPSTITTHGGKGESVAGTPRWIYDFGGSHTVCAGANTYYVNTQQPNDGYPGGVTYPAGGSMARGAPANAGGGSTDGRAGANDQNSGGGGGSNGGAGGHGGFTWSTVLDYGGRGAAVTPALTKLVLGGGGGAGTRNNDNCGVNGATAAQEGQASSGAAGGGLVLLRAGQVNVGAGAIVSADGATAFNDTLNDGGGGGGAGGSVIVTVNSGTMAGLTLQARGGSGGSAWRLQGPCTDPPGGVACANELATGATNNRHGPGGGGGGGVVAYTNTAVLPAFDVSGGASGITSTANSPFGAQAGAVGQTLFAAPGLIPGAGSGADCSPDPAIDLTHSETTVSPGGPVTFSATVRNAGPFVATSASVPITVTITLDPGLAPGTASGSGWTCGAFSGQTVTCSRSDTLGPQLSFPPITITATVLVSGPATLPANVATVSGGGDVNAANNTDTDPVGVRAPTLAHVRRFTAVRTGATVQLSWRTGYEVDNLGFRVYREVAGVRTLVTPSLVAGSALFAGKGRPLSSGRSYSWLDGPGVPRDAVYWLEDVDLAGARGWTGPVPLLGSSDPDVSREGVRLTNSPLLAALPTPRVRGRLGSGPGIGCERPCGDRLAIVKGVVSADRDPRWVAARPAAKILVPREGWYRVTAGELRAAGFDPRGGQLLRLFNEGVEQALAVVREEGSTAVQAVEFYGLGIDSPFDGSRVYWLVHDSPGVPIPTQGPAPPLPPAADSFAFTLERRDRTVTFFALDNGDAENIFGDPVSSDPLTLDLFVSHLDAAAPGSATLTVALQGVTLDTQHEVEVRVNGTTAGSLVFSGQEYHVGKLSVPQAWLHEGPNALTLTATGTGEDVSVVDSIRLTYAHRYVLDAGALRFTAPAGTQLTLSGIVDEPLRVVDVSDPLRPVELSPVVEGEPGSRTATVGILGSGTRTLFAFGPASAAPPAAVVRNRPSQWWTATAGADLVIISHASFEDQLAPLVARRRSQGLETAVVDVADVYDEQSFGQRTPYAIRGFLADAARRWQRTPRYLLLVGDASFDPKNYFGFGDWDLVPTKLVPTRYLETDSDDWLADLDGDGFAELAVGRLPARTPAQAALFVAKILAREGALGGTTARPPWARRALLVADENDEFDFESAAHALVGLLPGFAVTELRIAAAGPAASGQIVAAINAGQLVVDYVGHGSVESWGRREVFGTSEALGLTNAEKLPFVVAMTCLNGLFDDLFSESLAETLLKAPNGGAAAVWASSALTEPEFQATMNQALFRVLFGGAGGAGGAGGTNRIGDAVLSAKARVSDADVRRTFILFGDPTMPLR